MTIYFIYNYISPTFDDTDAIILLEHSFYLAQQDDPKPLSSAIEKYNALNICAKVATDLEEVFKQYNKASEKEKVDMVLLVIAQNRMGEFNMCLNILFISHSIPDVPAAK